MIERIRSKAVMTATAIALVAGLAGAVAAQDPGGPGGRHGGGRGFGPERAGVPLHALELSDAQRTQVREVMQSQREDMQAISTRLREAHKAQREAIETVPVNEALVRATSQALAAVETDMALLQARIHSQVWGVLTPDQQAKAKELKAQREARAQERGERRQRQRQQD
jgi:periplasmic protein CpxP/Spy